MQLFLIERERKEYEEYSTVEQIPGHGRDGGAGCALGGVRRRVFIGGIERIGAPRG